MFFGLIIGLVLGVVIGAYAKDDIMSLVQKFKG